LANAALSDAGNYDVIVSGGGSVTSAPPAILTLVTNLPAQPFFYEPFDYVDIGKPVSSNTPANWALGGTGTNDLNVASGSLSYPGLTASLGNSVTNGGIGLGTRRLFGRNLSSGVIYFSALFRMTDLGYGIWNGLATQVGALTATDSSSFRLQVLVQSNSPAGYLIGLRKGGTGFATSLDTIERRAGDTLFLVGKYDFTVSPNAVSLWINPHPTTLGVAVEPTSGFLFQTSGADGYVIDRFNMRQNTAASVPAGMQWDELRVGDSWAAVTPPSAETPTWLTSPTRLTNGAFRFAYTNYSTRTGTIHTSSNLAHWSVFGTATQVATGLFQFTDPTATNYPRRFYQLRVP
jgi:hypothetical protein